MLVGLWPFLQPYRWVLLLAVVSLLLTAGLNLSLGQGVRLIVDEGFVGGSLSKLNTILWSFLSVVVLLSLGTFARFYLVTWLGERVTADIRKAVFSHLITLEPNYFETNRSGELMSRLTTDTSVLQSIIGSSISFALRSLLLVLGGLVM
jgi:ATP-binding cassette subfamily B protein